LTPPEPPGRFALRPAREPNGTGTGHRYLRRRSSHLRRVPERAAPHRGSVALLENGTEDEKASAGHRTVLRHRAVVTQK
jgi:hypothetical protein